MQFLGGRETIAFGCSASNRIGGAVFAACDSEKQANTFYRVDSAISATWRSFRGYSIRPQLLNDASEANELLVGNIPSIRISREFVTAYVRINRALFKALQGESTSAGEFASLASSAAEKLDRTLGRTPEVATFEEECQAQSSTLLAGGMDEGSAREIRTLSGVWALKYQRFITPH